MRGTPFLKENFTLGLNTVDSPYTVQEGETRECVNVVSTTRGAIKKRNGSSAFAAQSVTAEFQTLESVNIPPEYFIGAAGKNLYSVNLAKEVSTIKEGMTEGERWVIIQAPKGTQKTAGPVYLVNGKDKPQFWSGEAKNTEAKLWEGASSNPESKKGSLPEGQRIIKTEEKEKFFLDEDTGRSIEFKTTVKQKAGEITIKTATIVRVLNGEEVEVAIDSEGWKETYSKVEFKILREYYEDATTKEHVPNGKFMVYHQNRIWMAGMSDDKSAVRFSGLATIGEGGEQSDPTAWPKENVVRFENSSAEAITGLATLGPYVLVFKERKTWVIHDPDTGENRQISDTVGCVANRSIVEVPGGAMFLTSDQGVWFTNGSKVDEMSYKVKPTILAINQSKRANAAAAYFNNHYYLSFTPEFNYLKEANEKNIQTLDYDFTLKSWWLHDLAGNQWALSERKLYTIQPKSKAGIVQAFDPSTFQDSGINYTGNGILGAFWLSHWEPFAYYIFRHRVKAPFLKKRIRQIFFNGTGEISVTAFKNFHVTGQQEPGVIGNRSMAHPESPINFAAAEAHWGEGTGIWGTGENFWGGEVATGAARIYAPGIAFVWSVGWGNNSKEPFEVDSYAYMGQFRKS